MAYVIWKSLAMRYGQMSWNPTELGGSIFLRRPLYLDGLDVQPPNVYRGTVVCYLFSSYPICVAEITQL